MGIASTRTRGCGDDRTALPSASRHHRHPQGGRPAMSDEERKDRLADEEIEDLEASEEDAEQVKGGALQSYLTVEGQKQGKLEKPQSTQQPTPSRRSRRSRCSTSPRPTR